MKSKQKRRLKRLKASQRKKRSAAAREPKMSAAIAQLARPLLDEYGDSPQHVESIIGLTIAGWNKSLLPAEAQPKLEKDLVDDFVAKKGDAHDISMALEIMDRVADHKRRLFPNLRRHVWDYTVRFVDDGHCKLNVVSTPISDCDEGPVPKPR